MRYTGSTPLLPPGVKSRGAGRLVSTMRHHFLPAGGDGQSDGVGAHYAQCSKGK